MRAACVGLVVLGCGGGGSGAPDATVDGPGSDGVISDAATSDGPAGFHDISDKTLWEAFDLSTFDPDLASGTGFFGGAFDGRYVYLTPYQRGVAGDASATMTSGLVVRYDTQAPFTTTSSWSSFDCATVTPLAVAFMSSAFDGRYVYFFPGPIDPMVARYDTQAPFGSASSWSTFQLTNGGFWDLAFDGRYLYSSAAFGKDVARYDTQGPFDAGAAWASFDPSQLAAAPVYPKAWVSAVFDGRYVYFGPGTASVANTIMGRYDTQAPFTATTSWTAFDIAPVAPKVTATAGMTFDGRYLYFVPYYASGLPSNVFARYDTQATLDSGAAWSTFDTTPIAGPITSIGAVFDGRYVYAVPWVNGQIERYDTAGSFADIGSWSHFDGTSVNPKAESFRGAVFDGRHVYFVPSQLSVVLRFDARSPPATPPGYHGSFF